MSDTRVDDDTDAGTPPVGPPSDATDAGRRARTSDDFLVPGPTATSNEGLRRWGVTWLAFSVLLMLMMLGISFGCWVLARAVGLA